jgi:tetratricopeptide (TPR) repeat protein
VPRLLSDAELGDLGGLDPGDFGEGLGERTVVMSGAYDLRPPFTGRTAQWSALTELTDRALGGDGAALAIVVGEPGMGKSRIAVELAQRAGASHRDALILTGAADESAATTGPIARALAAHFEVAPGDDPTASQAKILQGVTAVVAPARVPEAAHFIAHLLGAPFADSPIVTPLLDSPQRLEARLFMALRRYLAAEAARRPVLLLVENLERCGADTINFLRYLAAGVRGARLAIVGTATAALFERHPTLSAGDDAPAVIELGPLPPAEAEALLRQLCRSTVEVPPTLVDHVRGLGGSPRAIYELVRLLLESDVIVRDGPFWRCDPAALAARPLPRSYDEIVAARLAVMDPAERRALEQAAVVGEVSWLDAILALERQGAAAGDADGPTLAQIAASGDHSRTAVVAAIAKLIEREWLAEDGDTTIAGERELRFTYSNSWAILYRSVEEPRRRAYHAAAARWLELHPEGQAAAAQEEIGRHLALAGEQREAAVRYRRAASAARAEFQNERAIRQFDRALACLAAPETTDLAARLHIWHDLGSVYELIGDFEAALGAFERMLRLAWVAASKVKAGVAFNKMGRVWQRKGDLTLALEYLERGLELFRAAGDERGVAGSLDDIGRSLHLLGRYDDAHAKITEALARRGHVGDQRAIATSLSRLGDVQRDRGEYQAARHCHREALELRRAAADRWGVVVSQNALAELSFELGEHADARAGWLAALPDAEAMGALPLCALVLANLGALALAEGKLEEARSRLTSALALVDDIEDRGLESTCCRHLAQLERLLGHAAPARAHAERAIDVARRAGLREQEALAQLALAEVLGMSLYDASDDEAHPRPADEAFGAAISELRAIGNAAGLGRALVAFGRYRIERGEVASGTDMVRDAIVLFTRLELTRAADHASQLLASLA